MIIVLTAYCNVKHETKVRYARLSAGRQGSAQICNPNNRRYDQGKAEKLTGSDGLDRKVKKRRMSTGIMCNSDCKGLLC